MKAISCPNCGGPYNPDRQCCDYCGSYIILDKNEDSEFNANVFYRETNPENYKGIYLFDMLLDNGEYPVRTGPANLYNTPVTALGGALALTNSRLIFKPHGINLGSKKPVIINLSDVKQIKKSINLGVSAQFTVIDSSGKGRRFVVFKRKEWLEAIDKAMNGEFKPLMRSTGGLQNAAQGNNVGYIQELKDLKELLDAGIITQEEFDKKKSNLLS